MSKKWLVACGLAITVLAGCSREDDAGNSFGYDRNFIKMAGYSNRNSSEIGVLVTARSSDSVILSVAEAEKAAHQVAYDELMDIARTYPVNVPVAPDARHAELRQSMLGYSGRAFDSIYIHAQVADHKDAIRLFQEEVTYGTDPAVKAYAGKYLPILQAHLLQAETVAAGY